MHPMPPRWGLCSAPGPLMRWCVPSPRQVLLELLLLWPQPHWDSPGTLWGGRCCPKGRAISFFFFLISNNVIISLKIDQKHV